MEIKKEKMNETSDLSISIIDQNQDLYDDDMYIDDVYSLRRRLQNTEKIMVIILALISFPLAFGLLYLFKYESFGVCN